MREIGTVARFDRRAAEMLGLDMTLLAKAHGLNVARMEITTVKRTARALDRNLEKQTKIVQGKKKRKEDEK